MTSDTPSLTDEPAAWLAQGGRLIGEILIRERKEGLELRDALDFFYPAALGNWVAFRARRALPVPVRETFARQTGMYRITGLLDDDACRAVVAASRD